MLNYSWSEAYSVNDLILDDHHKTLLQLFDDLSNLLFDTEKKDDVLKIIHELKSYATFHFTEEEKRMVSNGYSDYEDHKAAHIEYISKISEFQSDFEENPQQITEELFLFLNKWLIDHIQEMDHQYIGKI